MIILYFMWLLRCGRAPVQWGQSRSSDGTELLWFCLLFYGFREIFERARVVIVVFARKPTNVSEVFLDIWLSSIIKIKSPVQKLQIIHSGNKGPARSPRRTRLLSRAWSAVLSTWIVAFLRNDKFFSFQELNKAIRIKLDEFNSRPFQKRKGCRLS